MRAQQRPNDKMRDIIFLPHYTLHAEGSVLACFGHTKVLCTASIENKVPPFLKGKNQGWITAEYGMLPRATHQRSLREAAKGKQTGRTQEIQRLIGRSLRAAINLNALGERTITLDCDVIQADGGTRTAAISGSYVALTLALQSLQKQGELTTMPLYGQVAAISVGICAGEICVDLDYAEDSTAETDMNIVMNSAGRLIEIQGTAEGHAFSEEDLFKMLSVAKIALNEIFTAQQIAITQTDSTRTTH